MSFEIIQMTTEGWGAFFCIIAAIVVWQTRNTDRKRVFGLIRFILADCVLLISDSIAIGFRGHSGAEAFYIVRVSYVLAYIMGFFVIITGVAYFGGMIENRVHVSIQNWKVIEYVIGVMGTCMILINMVFPFLYDFDSDNHLLPLRWNWLIHLSYMMGIVLILVLILNFFRDMTGIERLAVISALVFPLITLMLRYFGFEISLNAMSSFVSVVFTFVSYTIDYTARVVKRERDREKWIAEGNIRLLHDQIKPHFIYNALTGIYYGLDEDLPRSKQAIKDLTGYLRGSLDVLDERECVDFSKELETVKCYLDIEAFRFDDEIHVSIDAKDTDFRVPAFCMQTLVENAVRHGIREKNPPGGIVSISSRYEGGEHIVTITDDGIGFNPDEFLNDGESKADTRTGEAGRVHIGLRNTKKRLELMCGGTMEIHSEPGKGTSVSIRIPEE